jgi:transitional endoplasmic reticulum ATPase
MLLNMLPDVDLTLIEELAKRTIGYVAADLAALTRTIILEWVQRQDNVYEVNDSQAESTLITREIVSKALAGMTPSLVREYRVPVEGGLDWDDLGGMARIKMELQRAIEWPLQHKEAFARLGLQQPRGVLLHGPPGCSKTTIAKILASRGSFSFYSLSGAAVFSAYVGEAERLVRQVFHSARQTSPSLIFIDEMDALVGKRGQGDVVQERVLSTLLNEMDGIETMRGVVVLGATNRLNAIDAALLRPGRFDRLVHIPLPERNDRLDILQKVLRSTPIDKQIDLGTIADNTAGFSGADLKQLVQEAALCAIGRGHDRIESTDWGVV